MKHIILLCGLMAGCLIAYGQEPDSTSEAGTDTEEFDFSDFAPAEEVKAFCSSRILGGGPQDLFSVAYDQQLDHTLTAGPLGSSGQAEANIKRVREFRIDAQYPVISKNNITLALQLNYLRTLYDLEDETPEHPLLNTLSQDGLTSLSASTVLFKPLNMKNFMLFQLGIAANANFSLNNLSEAGPARLSAAAIYGWKPHERKMWGLGVSRTYLGGALNYLPVFYYQYAAANGKWGIDALLPSRFNVKRYFKPDAILSAGFNFQGNTYQLNNVLEEGNINDIVLRRSELRFRLIMEKGITKTLWVSAQTGLRYNWEFNTDEKDFFRSLFAEDPYFSENDLSNPLFFQLAVKWVSP